MTTVLSPRRRAQIEARGFDPDDYEQQLAAGDKWCSGCQKYHPRSEFGANHYKPDGLQNTCRYSASAAQRRHREKRKARNPELSTRKLTRADKLTLDCVALEVADYLRVRLVEVRDEDSFARIVFILCATMQPDINRKHICLYTKLDRPTVTETVNKPTGRQLIEAQAVLDRLMRQRKVRP